MPIALKYDEYGVLQFVRCLYFDVDITKCPYIYAIALKANSKRKNFQNYNILKEKLHFQDVYTTIHTKDATPRDMSYIIQTAPVQLDSMYSLAELLPFEAIDMSNAHIVEISAQDYLSKYGTHLKLSEIAIIDGNNNLVCDVTQVISAKLALYMTNNSPKNKHEWLIAQNSYLIPDDYCPVYTQYSAIKHKAVNQKVIESLPVDYYKYLQSNCTVFLIDYKGNIAKMPLEKALGLQNISLGNLTEGMFNAYYEGNDDYIIEKCNSAYSKFDQTDELNDRGTLYGIVAPANNYEQMIPATAISVITPSVYHLNLDIPKTYALQNIRFGDMTQYLLFKSQRDLGTVVLPKRLEMCDVKLKSVKQLELPQCCFKELSLVLEQYTSNVFRTEIQGRINIEIDNAPNLEYIDLAVNDTAVAVSSNKTPYISIRNAPKIRKIRLVQPDCVQSNFDRTSIYINTDNDYEIILDCDTCLSITCENPNQTITILCGFNLPVLSIITPSDKLAKIIIKPLRPDVKIGTIKIRNAYLGIIYIANVDDNSFLVPTKQYNITPDISFEGFPNKKGF